jgi:hypothetical protein
MPHSEVRRTIAGDGQIAERDGYFFARLNPVSVDMSQASPSAAGLKVC